MRTRRTRTCVRPSSRGRTDAYYEAQIAADRDAISVLYLNDGYESASVDVGRTPSADGRAIEVLFTIREGPQIIVDHVLIVGNRQIAASTIRREITLEEGEPLGLAAFFETRRRLNALGLFTRIDIREFSHGGGNRRDVVIVVDEAPATSVAYGAGLEVSQRLRRESGTAGQAVERLEFAPRGFFEIGRRNLWGKNRSINLFTRVSFRPSDDPADLAGNGGFGFNEYRLLGTYREPRAFGLTGNVLVTAFVEQSVRSSFDLFRRGLNAELIRPIRPTVSVSVGYTFAQNQIFEDRILPEDRLLIDRLFPTVVLSTFSTALVRDMRDDPVRADRWLADRVGRRCRGSSDRVGGRLRENRHAGLRVPPLARVTPNHHRRRGATRPRHRLPPQCGGDGCGRE